ncbi:hypothetical protein BGZ54_008268 [Gamsiella multidivaricata]|nr:hypothetical protein BGZ54_008268 [Gamsiella multidivaricata]
MDPGIPLCDMSVHRPRIMDAPASYQIKTKCSLGSIFTSNLCLREGIPKSANHLKLCTIQQQFSTNVYSINNFPIYEKLTYLSRSDEQARPNIDDARAPFMDIQALPTKRRHRRLSMFVASMQVAYQYLLCRTVCRNGLDTGSGADSTEASSHGNHATDSTGKRAEGDGGSNQGSDSGNGDGNGGTDESIGGGNGGESGEGPGDGHGDGSEGNGEGGDREGGSKDAKEGEEADGEDEEKDGDEKKNEKEDDNGNPGVEGMDDVEVVDANDEHQAGSFVYEDAPDYEVAVPTPVFPVITATQMFGTTGDSPEAVNIYIDSPPQTSTLDFSGIHFEPPSLELQRDHLPETTPHDEFTPSAPSTLGNAEERRIARQLLQEKLDEALALALHQSYERRREHNSKSLSKRDRNDEEAVSDTASAEKQVSKKSKNNATDAASLSDEQYDFEYEDSDQEQSVQDANDDTGIEVPTALKFSRSRSVSPQAGPQDHHSANQQAYWEMRPSEAGSGSQASTTELVHELPAANIEWHEQEARETDDVQTSVFEAPQSALDLLAIVSEQRPHLELSTPQPQGTERRTSLPAVVEPPASQETSQSTAGTKRKSPPPEPSYSSETPAPALAPAPAPALAQAAPPAQRTRSAAPLRSSSTRKESTLSEKRPTSSEEKPTLSENRLVLSTKRPVSSQRRSTSSTKRPSTSEKKPVGSQSSAPTGSAASVRRSSRLADKMAMKEFEAMKAQMQGQEVDDEGQEEEGAGKEKGKEKGKGKGKGKESGNKRRKK